MKGRIIHLYDIILQRRNTGIQHRQCNNHPAIIRIFPNLIPPPQNAERYCRQQTGQGMIMIDRAVQDKVIYLNLCAAAEICHNLKAVCCIPDGKERLTFKFSGMYRNHARLNLRSIIRAQTDGIFTVTVNKPPEPICAGRQLKIRSGRHFTIMIPVFC